MQLKIDIYGATINIDILESVEDCHSYIIELNKNHNKDYEVIKFEGCVFPLANRVYNLALLKPFINHNVISHECYHLTGLIADACDIEDENYREARAYLNGYINEKVWELVKLNLVNS